MKSLQIILLTYNEEVNIARTLDDITSYGFENIVVYDSGSTDKTLEIIKNYNVKVIQHTYIDHCSTYNKITINLDYDYYIILDSDTYLSAELVSYIENIMKYGSKYDVFKAKVDIYIEGIKLKYGSLYPDKPFLFKSGKEYFIKSGHGEELRTKNVDTLPGRLNHDDRKEYSDVLMKQLKYIDRAYKIYLNPSKDQQSPMKDKIRFSSGLWIFITGTYIFFIKKAFLSGRVGGLYIVNRLIVELLYYRKGLLEKLKNK